MACHRTKRILFLVLSEPGEILLILLILVIISLL